MSEVLVIGGGPAGAAVATALSQAGRQVVLVERESAPRDKVCGEFLSAEALGYLQALAVDVTKLGAVPIDAVRLVRGRKVAAQELPFAARSLSRRRLDEALLDRAAACGVRVLRGLRAESLVRDGDGWTARLTPGHKLTADSVFLCTGKHEVRGWKRPPGKQGDLIAFKMHWRLTPAQHAALGRCVELVLFADGYGGLEPIEDGLANLCVLVQRQRLQELGGWDGLLTALKHECGHLAERLDGAEAIWERPLALSAIPYGYVGRQTDGIWRLGDQAAVIPSFSGDGISIALHSARVAAESFLSGMMPAEFQARLHKDVARQVAVATAISRAIIAAPGALMAAARLCPLLLKTAARLTRIHQAALRGSVPIAQQRLMSAEALPPRSA